jgi:surface antigen
MSDISHISIVLVILFALISGIPGAFSSANKVSIDPFVPIKTAKQEYISKTEKRILEADSVATLSSVYSDSLGQDAIKVAEDLNNKIAVATNNNDYLNSQPIISMPDVANTRNKIITYVVRDGDTLSGIAAKFNITTATIRYANKLEDENSVKPGQTLTILPITGLIHTVSAGDTLAGIAARYKANQEMIISQNDLYGEEIVAGMQLLIPDGEIPDAPKPVIAPVATPGSGSGSDDSDGLSYVKISYGPNHFPWGYCTWWVAQKRSVPWNGNAWQWYGNAQSYGRPTGRTPVPGAIMVTWESGVGHVAYVESVSGGSFTVSEMNYRGYGIVSSRTLTTSSVPLIGFIY